MAVLALIASVVGSSGGCALPSRVIADGATRLETVPFWASTLVAHVIDQTGASMPGIEVAVVAAEGHRSTEPWEGKLSKQTCRTNEMGMCAMSLMHDVDYRVEAQAPGFWPFRKDHLAIAGGGVRTILIKLVMGPIGE